jgi:putative ABC transport system permease protein
MTQVWRVAQRTARRPAFLVAVLITFVLGIAANAVVFNAVYDALIRPLPYGQAASLVVVVAKDTSQATVPPAFAVTLPQFEDWSARSMTIERGAVYTVMRYTASAAGEAALVRVAVVSHAYFDTLSMPATEGRIWSADEEALPVMVVSSRIARRIHGPLKSANAAVALNGIAFTVVGVMDELAERLTGETDAWIPVETARRIGSAQFRERGIFGMVARLRPGVAASTAEHELAQLTARTGLPTGGPFTLVPLTQYLAQDVREPLMVLLAIAAMLYLVAVTNLLGATLVHTAARRHEFAIRSALGATKAHLIRHAGKEAALLGLLGLGAALTASWWLTGIAAALPIVPTVSRPSRLSAAAVLYVVILAGIAAAIVAVTLVWAGASRGRLGPKKEVVAFTSGATRHVVVVLQVALSVTLVYFAMSFAGALNALLARDVGLDPKNTLVVEVGLSSTLYAAPADQAAYARRLRDRLSQLPGVRRVAYGTALPARRAMGELVVPLTRPDTGASEMVTFDNVPVSANYLESVGARLLRGRLLVEGDDAPATPVVVISRRAARRAFGTDDVVGRTFRVGRLPSTGQQSVATIVGVVEDVRFGALEAEPNGAVYIPFGHRPFPRLFVTLEAIEGDALQLAGPAQHAIREVDATQLITAALPIDQLVRDATAQPRFRSVVTSGLAVLAFTLAIGGIMATTAAALREQRRACVIRLALGATPSHVVGATVLRFGGTVLLGVVAAAGLVLVCQTGAAAWLASLPPFHMHLLGYAAAAQVVIAVMVAYGVGRLVVRLDLASELRRD